ncbi:site-2 protease family protein, partial [bacterium]|nr:site-2 protease family protein [bacterium]
MSWMIAFLVLSLLIFLHELGHYSAARYFGVYVEVFSIGFGKKLGSFKAFGTQWQFSAIPLGGYVKMKGQDDLDPTALSSDNDSYNSKKPWQRIIILLSGPMANFLTAWILFY